MAPSTQHVMEGSEPTIAWRSFLLESPPGTKALVERAAFSLDQSFIRLNMPELELYCAGECQGSSHCKGSETAKGKLFGGNRQLHPAAPFPQPPPAKDLPYDVLLSYSCERCGWLAKSYALRFWTVAPCGHLEGYVSVEKLAETPAFSPPTPSKLTKLIGPDRDLFLQGRRAEVAGLGIGAVTYYRRIVEQQKNRLVDAIIDIEKRGEGRAEILKKLEDAKSENQFKKAVVSIESALPKLLYIHNSNPFTLLYHALSRGVHEMSDDECLQQATDIRLVLIAFSEKLSEALNEDRELKEAVKRLKI